MRAFKRAREQSPPWYEVHFPYVKNDKAQLTRACFFKDKDMESE